MKKEYHKPLYLDTCIVKNILGYDNDPGKIARHYERERIIKHIQHHGCVLTIFTLLEMYRSGFEEMVDRLKSIRYNVLIPIINQSCTIDENMVSSMKVEEKLKYYINLANREILAIASHYYTRIFLYPVVFTMHYIAYDIDNSSGAYDGLLGNEYLKKVTEKLQAICHRLLKKELNEQDNHAFRKSCDKSLNQFYKCINQICVNWYNEEIQSYYTDKSAERLIAVQDGLINKIEHTNFDDELFLDEKNREKQADERTNIMYLIYKKMCSEHTETNAVELRKMLVQACLDRIDELYCFENKIVAEYYKQTIQESFIKHIENEGMANAKHKLFDLIDLNDVIDLASLKFSNQKEGIFFTTDKKIIRVQKKAYDRKRLTIIKDFLRPDYYNSIA